MKNLFFAYLHSIGISQRKLFSIFEAEEFSAKEFYETLSEKLLEPYFPNLQQRTKILETKSKLDTTFIDKVLKENEVSLVTYFDENYPEVLKNIANPPFLLYIQGTIDNSPKLGIIGSRKMTSYGEKILDTLIPTLSQYFTIVSGGAIGCDTKAHQVSLKSGGKTIVIVGTGIDKAYPPNNKKLYQEIVGNGGAIISIFPIGEDPQTYNFPIRNEILAGLSNGVLLVEAGEKSGTLITAQLALDQGKDLFAVPGDIYKINSFGCNNLIKRGEAKMVTTLSDILEEYNFHITEQKTLFRKQEFSSKREKDIYDLLILQPLTIDEITKKLGLGISDVAITLSLLEISQSVKKVQNGIYEVC